MITRLIVLILALICAIAPAGAVSEADDIARLETEIEELRAELDALRQELHSYVNPTVIAKFDGGNVYFADVYSEYENVRAMYDLFYMSSLDDDPVEALSLQKQIARELTERAVMDAYIAKNGVSLLSDEQITEIHDKAEQTHAELLIDYTDEFLVEIGCDITSLIDEYTDEALSIERIKYFAGSVDVTDEYLWNMYEEYALADEEYFTSNPLEFSFESVYSDELITWIPDGFRRIRKLLVPFTDEQLEARDNLVLALDSAKTDDDRYNINKSIDDIYAQLIETANAVRSRIDDGEKIVNLLDEYSQTDDFLTSDLKQGIIVSDTTAYVDPNVISAAMALENTGDVSAPVRVDAGYAIIEYVSDVRSGRVPFEEVRDRLYDIARETLEYEQYRQNVEKLLAEAHVEYYFAGLN